MTDAEAGGRPIQELTVIESGLPSGRAWLREIVSYRELLVTLVYRDLRVRYAQTVLGILWALLQPAATLLVFTVVFGRAIGIDTGTTPYALFAVAGLAAWTYFAFVVSNAGGSIIGSQALLKKVYFPRLIIPASKALVGLVDFAIAMALFALLMAWHGRLPGPKIVFLPVFLTALLVSSVGVGVWLSALTIRFRDFQHIVPFIVQIGLYATPVAYPSQLIPDRYRVVYFLNPATGPVEGLRWCLLGDAPLVPEVILSLVVGLLLLVTALIWFRRVESTIADLV